MRIFVIHLSRQTCLDHQLKERDITPLLESLRACAKHPVEVFDAIYAKTSQGLHPLVQEHAHPYFMHKSCLDAKNAKLLEKPYTWHGLKALASACYHAFRYRGKFMSAGELGCYASHYLLWQHCTILNEPIVVLEDDVYLEPPFFESLDFLQEHIKTLGYVRLMHLSYAKTQKVSTDFSNVSEIVDLTDGLGTQGYCLAPRIATKFIQASPTWVMPVDWVMDNHYLHGVKNLVLEPFSIAGNQETGAYSNVSRFEDQKCPLLLRLFKKLNSFYVKNYTRARRVSKAH